MKRRIVVEYGEVNKIAELIGCTNVMVSHALAFRKNSRLARSIRKLALERGGTHCLFYPPATGAFPGVEFREFRTVAEEACPFE